MYRLSSRELRLEPEQRYDDPDEAPPYIFLWAGPGDWDEDEEPEPDPFWSFEVWPVKQGRVEVKVWDDMAPPGLRTAFTDLLKYQLTPVRDRDLINAEGKPEPPPKPLPGANGGRPRYEVDEIARRRLRNEGWSPQSTFKEWEASLKQENPMRLALRTDPWELFKSLMKKAPKEPD
jgi:hypothetical protein